MDRDQIMELYQHLGKTIKEFRDNYILAQCPNPDHADDHPSCRIGIHHPHPFKCWSCGYTGTLAKVAKDNGIQVTDSWDIHKFDQKRSMQLPDLSKLRLEQWSGDYRGLDEATWKRFGALKWWDTHVNPETGEERLNAIRLLLPVHLRGIFVGYVGRRLDAEKLMRYNNYSGAAFTELLYLYDTIQPQWPVVLVEGPLDAIRYNLNGIPSVAIFGVENWSDSKLRLLLEKSPTTVWLSMDADQAGQNAQRKLYNQLRRFFDVQVIQMPQGVDPFELAPELLAEVYKQIWKHYRKRTGQPEPEDECVSQS